MKKIIFTNQEGSISVSYNATLKDPFNLNEQFYIQESRDMTTYRELSLFYFWSKLQAWTLNEMQFFALCNNLCLGIFEDDTLLAQYGICSGEEWKVFDDVFDDVFA